MLADKKSKEKSKLTCKRPTLIHEPNLQYETTESKDVSKKLTNEKRTPTNK
jgi:hypothetical protein